MKYLFRLIVIISVAGAIWYYYLRDTGEVVVEVVVVPDAAKEYLSLNDAPVYVQLGSVIAPIFRGAEPDGSLIVVVVLEITRSGYDDDVREQMAAIKDALLVELYGASERLAAYGEEPDVVDIKQRFRAAAERVLGEGVVADLLLQDFVHKDE